MTMNVQGPGGITVAFPDGTDPATVDQVMRQATSGQGDLQPMAAGAIPHAMPADMVSGGPPQASPSVGGDMAASAGSRLAAGALDIPGTGGDLMSLADNAGSAAARGILSLFGVSPEKRQQAQAAADAAIGNPALLPTSEGVKRAAGFQAYQPQTGAGQVFDKYVGSGIEMVPGVVASGGASLARKAAAEGLGAAVKQGAGEAAKYALAPAATSEVAGDVTKGTPLEPIARLAAAVATGGVAGAKGAKVTGALTGDQWREVADQAYKDVKNAGIGIKPNVFGRMVSDAEQELHAAGYRPSLEGHGNVKTVLDEMKAAAFAPQSFQELDQMHQLARTASKSIHPNAQRVGGMLADKIDNFMENLKPGDLMSGNNPGAAWATLVKARDAWRRMRTGERMDDIIARAKDKVEKSGGTITLQKALKDAFDNFKWAGGAGKARLTPEFTRMSNEEKMLVNGIIGGGKALQTIGKFNFRNPVVTMLMGALGATGSPLFAAGALGAGEAARRLSAAGTLRKANQLDNVIRGGKIAPGRWGRPPNAILLGAAAQGATDRSKQSGQ